MTGRNLILKSKLTTPVGELHVFASEKGIRGILWPESNLTKFDIDAKRVKPSESPIFENLSRQLEEYFSGKRRSFDLPLDPIGTEFQMSAWKALTEIPFGETRTYGQQAKIIGRPKAARAVGAANGKNPISIVVPCHRVIGKNGNLTGFAGGLCTKQKLLKHERDQIELLN
jgi:methylated-DNA-[protein]-cysteine S-methyltransferase